MRRSVETIKCYFLAILTRPALRDAGGLQDQRPLQRRLLLRSSHTCM